MGQPMPKRIEAITAELDNAAQEYVWAKDAFQETQVAFEAAREKLAGIKQLATAMMPTDAWYKWQADHGTVRYVGMSLGEAIIAVLQNYAYQRAINHAQYDLITDYEPAMTKDAIVSQLEDGGFDFRTTTPLRELSAALLRLDGVVENADGTYETEVAAGILERVKQIMQGQKEGQ